MSENPNTIRVVAATIDSSRATLYLEDGTTKIVQQGDTRLAALVEHIIEVCARKEVAVVDLAEFSVYAAFEKKSNGLFKMFKMATQAVKKLFTGEDDKTVEIEEAPVGSQVMPQISEAEVAKNADKAKAFVNKSIPEAQTLTDDNRDDDDIKSGKATVVAVVETADGPKVIPNMEKIKPLLAHAARNNSTKAVENFMRRLAAIIDKRRHSVEDLFKFLEHADLPLADDGSIIAYKRLNSKDKAKGIFVDCHTGKVEQKVGSYVCVKEELVDLNRRNDCSNGLHIARRSYLKNFGGNILTLCKIDPE